MQALSNMDPERLHAILLTLCLLLAGLGIVKIALFLIMTLSPGVWEALIEKENAFYIRIGLLSENGSAVYKKIEQSPWTKAFFGCGGLAILLFSIAVIALVHWMKSLSLWENI